MNKIYHIIPNADWEKALKENVYIATSIAKEGFIHCSLAHQIPEVANYNFKGRQDLLILEIDVSKLNHEVRFEDLYNSNEDFPHIYGALNLNAILRIAKFPTLDDGSFEFPNKFKEFKNG